LRVSRTQKAHQTAIREGQSVARKKPPSKWEWVSERADEREEGPDLSMKRQKGLTHRKRGRKLETKSQKDCARHLKMGMGGPLKRLKKNNNGRMRGNEDRKGGLHL